MALPPTIPTSFVPRQPVAPRASNASFNPFLFIAYIIFFVWLIVAVLVFAYHLYLTRAVAAKSEEVAQVEGSIDQASVTEFIKLRDRFTTSSQVLDRHVVQSKLFDRIEELTVTNVRITKLKVTVQENRTAKLEIAGVARNFNALAAQSSAFAQDKDIRNAIFSGFTLDDKDGTVAFQINADVEPSLITQTATEVSLEQQQQAPQQSEVAAPQTATTTP